MCFDFRMRPEGDADVIRIRFRLSPTVAFRDVQRNRDGSAPDLRREAVHLFAWKRLRCLVTSLYEVHRHLPRLQLSIGGICSHGARESRACAGENLSTSA